MASGDPSELRLPVWGYLRGLALPLVIWLFFVGLLAWALYDSSHAWQATDEANLHEWLEESRVSRKTLPELTRDYLKLCEERDREAAHPAGEGVPPPPLAGDPDAKAEEIAEYLRDLADPTRIYAGQHMLFPDIYELEVRFDSLPDQPRVVWRSPVPVPRRRREPGQPEQAGAVQTLEYRLLGEDDPRVRLRCVYRLHTAAAGQRQVDFRRKQTRFAVGVILGAGMLALFWGYMFLRRERRRELGRVLARQQAEHAERVALETKLRAEEAERQSVDAEREAEHARALALENQLRAQEAEQAAAAAERATLEMKSQLFASIGIMAGSYAHNIKNLLVRPNDLLARCLETNGMSSDQKDMLGEVRSTLGTVTERLQQILRTVRRDPTRTEMVRLDLNELVRGLERTWEDLGREKWRLELTAETTSEPLPIEGDLSHLTQAFENLIFNARDATFEMRIHLRDEAHQVAAGPARRQAILEANNWRGRVALRAYRDGDQAVLEVRDNGIGMTEEVRRRCTETHFSTKRDNAKYQGDTVGMGLGLSFVTAVLTSHGAKLEVESEPFKGALFRLRFPLIAGDGRS
jgi:signal transduction histidine kinase